MAMTKAEFEQRLVDGVEAIGGIGPYDETYLFQAQDFGNGDAVEVIQGPANKTGVVRSITLFNVTEVFNEVTTPARVDTGTVADPNGYTAGASLGSLAVAASLAQLPSAGVLGNAIVGDTVIQLSFIAPTGGTPTGIADVQVTIQWS